MTTVLVTGGTGALGRELVPRVAAAGHKARVMSRRAGKNNGPGDTEWAAADLLTGEGVESAVTGVDVILHAASSPFKSTREVDVGGTQHLLDAAKAAGVSNFYYISIVGVDKVRYPYYRYKLEAENVIAASGVPHTILRATQFHPLLDTFLKTIFKRGPFLVLPMGVRFQLIDAGEVADHMVRTMKDGPSGRIPDIGGPKVEKLSDIAKAWLVATGRRLIRVPMIAPPGGISDMAKGYLTTPDNRVGSITWAQWLAKTYPSS
jgi:uncharacterized protein YbjT (DUF2867 family)